MSFRTRLHLVCWGSLIIVGFFFFLGSTPYGQIFSERNVSLAIRLITTVGGLFGFYLLDRLADLKMRLRHYLFVGIILLGGVMLSPLYFLIGWYDKVLHIIQPMLLASIVFHIVVPLQITSRWKFFFTFFVVLGALGLFEIGEYLIDITFDYKLQGVFRQTEHGFVLVQERIDDTIIDMIFGIIGTLTYVFFRAFYGRRLQRHE